MASNVLWRSDSCWFISPKTRPFDSCPRLANNTSFLYTWMMPSGTAMENPQPSSGSFSSFYPPRGSYQPDKPLILRPGANKHAQISDNCCQCLHKSAFYIHITYIVYMIIYAYIVIHEYVDKYTQLQLPITVFQIQLAGSPGGSDI